MNFMVICCKLMSAKKENTTYYFCVTLGLLFLLVLQPSVKNMKMFATEAKLAI